MSNVAQINKGIRDLELGSTPPPVNTVRCYLENRVDPVAEAALLNSTGGGHAQVLHSYTTHTFPTNIDLATVDTAGVDSDGIPHISTAYVTNKTGAFTPVTANRFSREEFLLYVPRYYHAGANAGKKISLSIVDIATNTTSGESEIYANLAQPVPSLDRGDQSKVASADAGVSYSFPPELAGKLTRTTLIGRGPVNWRARITFEDGTAPLTTSLLPWVWTPDSTPSLPAMEQTKVRAVVSNETGAETWYDSEGNETTRSAFCEPLVPVDCAYDPMFCTYTQSGDTYTIASATGGTGGPYEGTFDGVNFQPLPVTFTRSDTSDASEPDILQLCPQVKDAAGNVGPAKSSQVVIQDPVDVQTPALRVTDAASIGPFTSPQTSDPTEAGGFEIDYTTLCFNGVTTPMDTVTREINAEDHLTATGTNYLRYFLTQPSMGNVDDTYTFDGVTIPDGVEYFIEGRLRTVYYGINNATHRSLLDFQATADPNGETFQIVSNNTPEAATADDTHVPNTASTSTWVTSGIGTGSDVKLNWVDNSTTPPSSTGVEADDAASHYYDLNNIRVYKNGDRATSTTNHFYRVSNYVSVRGIDEGSLIRTPDSVATADAVRIKASLRNRGGDWDAVAGAGWKIEYRLDGGDWVTDVEVEGNSSAAGRIYGEAYCGETIDVGDAETIQTRVVVNQGGNSGLTLRIYDLSIQEVDA